MERRSQRRPGSGEGGLGNEVRSRCACRPAICQGHCKGRTLARYWSEFSLDARQQIMWEARCESIPSGQRVYLFEGSTQLSFREFFDLLEKNSGFVRWYSQLLTDCPFAAYFWEHPPFTADSFDNAAEFVLIESSVLAMFRPNPAPFESHFAHRPNSDIVVFPNLSADALLIAPSLRGPIEAYTHLATFLRNAPAMQTRSLFKVTAQTVRENLGAMPRWLSTCGLGVSWLHLRLDTRPKYYQFEPYRNAT